MTFRAKPVVKRSRSPWASDDRRNLYLNLGFGLVVVLSLAILAIAAGASWYEEHLGFVASVDDRTLTRDNYRDRLIVENFRLNVAESRVSTERAAGRWTEAQVQAQLSLIDQRRQQLTTNVLEQIIDAAIQERLAVDQGVSPSEADIDARLITEATTPAQRHAWAIEIEPVVAANEFAPTPEAIAEAKARAASLLAQLKSGKSFEELAKAESDGPTAAQGGDLGWIVDADPVLDADLIRAIFAAPANQPTEVVEGQDGTFRIGLASELLDPTVDQAYTQRIQDAGIALATYRTAVRADVIRAQLQDKITADLLKAGPQRHVIEVFIGAPQAPPAEGAVKARHILYSPTDDPSQAASLPEDDPAWKTAQDRAKATYDLLKNNPSKFDETARRDSYEGQARQTGGKLPYFDPSSGIDQAFADAIFAPGLLDGRLLEPVRSAFGWHVIQIMYRPTDLAQLEKLKRRIDAGADANQIARDFSDVSTARDGGDIGWITRGQQYDDRLTQAIFAAPIGGTTSIVSIENDGLYLYKVLEEETREPDQVQIDTIQNTAFAQWYNVQKSGVKIERNEAFLGLGT